MVNDGALTNLHDDLTKSFKLLFGKNKIVPTSASLDALGEVFERTPSVEPAGIPGDVFGGRARTRMISNPIGCGCGHGACGWFIERKVIHDAVERES